MGKSRKTSRRQHSRKSSSKKSFLTSQKLSRKSSRTSRKTSRENVYILTRATDKKHKYVVETPSGKHVKFGAYGMSDYTIHKDPERRQRYINRHKGKENWTKSGLSTAGFWSLHLLWGKPSLTASIHAIEDHFHIRVLYRR